MIDAKLIQKLNKRYVENYYKNQQHLVKLMSRVSNSKSLANSGAKDLKIQNFYEKSNKIKINETYKQIAKLKYILSKIKGKFRDCGLYYKNCYKYIDIYHEIIMYANQLKKMSIQHCGVENLNNINFEINNIYKEIAYELRSIRLYFNTEAAAIDVEEQIRLINENEDQMQSLYDIIDNNTSKI